MKMKFAELSDIDSQPIKLASKPKKNGDHAVISYYNLRNQELNVSVSPEEFETIEFSQDGQYMRKPACLNWVKGSKGPYLAKNNNVSTAGTPADIQW